MTFVEAITSGFQNYLNFHGRTQRSGYWYWMLFVSLAGIVTYMVDGWLFGFHEDGTGGVLSLIFSLAVLLPGIAVGVRRLHDLDRTGWWLLLSLIPLVGVLVLIFAFFIRKGTDGPNRFGPDPLSGSE